MDFLAPESPACRTPWQVISTTPELSFLATAALQAGLTSAPSLPGLQWQLLDVSLETNVVSAAFANRESPAHMFPRAPA